MSNRRYSYKVRFDSKRTYSRNGAIVKNWTLTWEYADNILGVPLQIFLEEKKEKRRAKLSLIVIHPIVAEETDRQIDRNLQSEIEQIIERGGAFL